MKFDWDVNAGSRYSELCQALEKLQEPPPTRPGRHMEVSNTTSPAEVTPSGTEKSDNGTQSSDDDSLSNYLGMSFFIAPSKNKTFEEKLSAAASNSPAVDECRDSEGQQQYSSIRFLRREFGIYFYGLRC